MARTTDFNSLAQGLVDDGGFSHSMRTGRAPTVGTMVARVGSEEVTPGNASALQIQQFADRHEAELQDRHAYLGGWVDDGKTYLDVSDRWPTGIPAETSLAANEQLAGFDVADFEEVETPNTLPVLDQNVQPSFPKRRGMEQIMGERDRRRRAQDTRAAQDPLF